jgi:prephenate dehydratase
MRVALLGPAGTFSEDALRAAAGDERLDAMPMATIHDAVLAVESGATERAFVPFENSSEGAVRPTLDALAFDAPGVAIVGEHDHPITISLIAREPVELSEVEAVVSHPQASAQCAGFLRAELPAAAIRAAASTGDAVRAVAAADRPWAALGAASAAAIYDCVVLREGVEDEPGNVTRFVWLAPAGTEPAGGGDWRTTFSFAELGADHPGALVEALTEFSSREVNLTRIESRPLRDAGLGRYMFFCDLEGRIADPRVAAAIEGLRSKAESVRVLGSYPLRTRGIPGA